MTIAAILELVGGVRAAVFLALALALGAAAGVQTWRVGERGETIDLLNAQAALWQQANADNMKAIADLQAANDAWADIALATEQRAAEAVDAVARERDALAAELEERRRARGKIYEADQDAAEWGRARVPARVADSLRE